MADDGPFNFSAAMGALMADMAATCQPLRHVDMGRVAVAFAQARHRRLDGMLAATYPLRFEGGATTAQMDGHTYRMPRVVVGGREMLYVVSFALPRFLDLPFEEKLAVVAHELYHIGPRFDGALRRFAGSKPYHTASQRRYDAAMARLALRYVDRTRRPGLQAFLRRTFGELVEAHGGVVGVRVRNLDARRVD
ncbi:MAG: putative metallopeptidase [Candidatus Brocadiia bacterium]